MNSNTILFSRLDSPAGRIYLGEFEGRVCKVSLNDRDGGKFYAWVEKEFPYVGTVIHGDSSPALAMTAQQLDEYFRGDRRVFSVPLHLVGTDFQRLIWRTLSQIPYGHTISYGDLAKRACRPGSARAVGGACGRNPVPILIPCHRVIGSSGKMTGFGGGIALKKKILALEGHIFE